MGSGISLISSAVAENCCQEQQSISVLNTPHLGEEGVQYFIDTSGGAVTLQLPSSPSDGDVIEVYDSLGQFAINNLTVDGNGNTIKGSATEVLSDTFGSSQYIYSLQASEWLVFSGGGGSGTVTGFQNGLTLNSSLGELGGTLLQNTSIEFDANQIVFTDNGFGKTGDTATFVDDGSKLGLNISDGTKSVRHTSDGFDFTNSNGTDLVEYVNDGSDKYMSFDSRKLADVSVDTLASLTALETGSTVVLGELYYETTSNRYGYGQAVDNIVWFDESGIVTSADNGLGLVGTTVELGGTISKNTSVVIETTLDLTFDVTASDSAVVFQGSNNETVRIEDTGILSIQDSVAQDSLIISSNSIVLSNTGSVDSNSLEMNTDGTGKIGDVNANGQVDLRSQILVDSVSGQIGFSDGSVLYLEDSNNQKWQITVNTLGNLVTTQI